MAKFQLLTVGVVMEPKKFWFGGYTDLTMTTKNLRTIESVARGQFLASGDPFVAGRWESESFVEMWRNNVLSPHYANNMTQADLPNWLRVILLPDMIGLNGAYKHGAKTAWKPVLGEIILAAGKHYDKPGTVFVYQSTEMVPNLAGWIKGYRRLPELFGAAFGYEYFAESRQVWVGVVNPTRPGATPGYFTGPHLPPELRAP